MINESISKRNRAEKNFRIFFLLKIEEVVDPCLSRYSFFKKVYIFKVKKVYIVPYHFQFKNKLFFF